jgi:NodT family efflux transporter outer membrane factor (OMF) lipoprotein
MLALGACAVGPDYQRPRVAVTGEWQTADEDPRIDRKGPVEGNWWRSFEDPALDRLVAIAQRQNLPLQIVGLRLLESRAQLGVAWGQLFPQVQVAFGQITAQRISRSAPNAAMLDRSFIDYQIGFDALWELDLWGKYRRGIEAEEHNVRASELDHQYGIVSLTAEVARTYTVVRTFEVLIEQALENEKIEQEGLEIARARFETGATPELDVTQATTLLESTRASIPRLTIGLEQARNSLSTLLGQPPGTIDELLAGPKDIPKPPASIAVGVPVDILRRRPDVRSAEERARAQCARVGIAKAEYYPKFIVFGTFGLEKNTDGGANFDFVDSLFYSVGPRIVWPFLNYGRISNSVRVQDARFQQLLVEYRDSVLRAAQEVEDAIAGFINAQKALVFEDGSVAAARRSVEISLAAYREGAVDFQRVLDAQRELLERQNSLVDTRASVATNLIALYKALGGGWESSEGKPTLPVELQVEMEERTSWGDLLPQPGTPETKP